jgi:hypothetical protein
MSGSLGRRCSALGCNEPVAAALAVGTVAGFTLHAGICEGHAKQIAEMRARLPQGLREWAGDVSRPEQWPDERRH